MRTRRCASLRTNAWAERAGFEPAVGLLALRTLSKRLPSATRSPLQRPEISTMAAFGCAGSGVMYRRVKPCQRHAVGPTPGHARGVKPDGVVHMPAPIRSRRTLRALFALFALCVAALGAPARAHACRCAPKAAQAAYDEAV